MKLEDLRMKLEDLLNSTSYTAHGTGEHIDFLSALRPYKGGR